MACLFLAAKIEENCRRLRDIANVFHHLKQKRMGRCVDCLVVYGPHNKPFQLTPDHTVVWYIVRSLVLYPSELKGLVWEVL